MTWEGACPLGIHPPQQSELHGEGARAPRLRSGWLVLREVWPSMARLTAPQQVPSPARMPAGVMPWGVLPSRNSALTLRETEQTPTVSGGAGADPLACHRTAGGWGLETGSHPPAVLRSDSLDLWASALCL